MSQPNPFSLASSYDHLVNPKIVMGNTGYQVKVDIANVDTIYGKQLGGSSGLEFQQAFINKIGSTVNNGQAFFSQIGSTGVSGYAGNAYFNDLYYNNLIPFPGSQGQGAASIQAGPGIQLSAANGQERITSLIQAGEGISINTPSNGQPYTISSTIQQTQFSVQGSQYIDVQKNGSTFTVSYTGLQGSGPTTSITGISGAYAVYGSSGITSSTVLTSQNVVGTTGELMLYSSKGPTSSSLFSANVSGRTLTIPSTIITDNVAYPTNAAYLRITADSGAGFIQPGNSRGGSTSLNITGPFNTPASNLASFDIPGGKVTINPSYDYPTGSVFTSSGFSNLHSFVGITGYYNIYLYGGGGAGLSGYPGGAGGFVKIENVYYDTVTNGQNAFDITVLPGINGGGTGLAYFWGGQTYAVVPGGGAGGTAGRGAAYGEPGGSYPGQGYSANLGGGSGGIYSNIETNGTTGFNYRIGTTGVTAQSGIFNNIQVTYGLTGYLSSGTKILGYGAITNVIGADFATYYFPPGSTMVFQTNGVTFQNSSYSFSGITYGILDLSVLPTLITPTTFARQADGGTFINDSSQISQQVQGGFISGNFSGDGSGIDQMLIGQTFSVGVTGITLTVNYGTVFTDFGITGGIEIDFSGGLTFSFSRSLGSTIAPSVRITDPIFVSPNSIIQVQRKNTISYGQTAGGNGGAGNFTGGGGIQGGGGGAGSLFLRVGGGPIGSTGAGSGTRPPLNKYNLNGQYGFGGSGTYGGSPYYFIERAVQGAQPDVLQVNGNESLVGGLRIQGYLPNSGNNSIFASNDITTAGALQSDRMLVGSSTRPGGSIYGFNGTIVTPVGFPTGLFCGGTLGNSNASIDSTGNIVAQNLGGTSSNFLIGNIRIQTGTAFGFPATPVLTGFSAAPTCFANYLAGAPLPGTALPSLVISNITVGGFTVNTSDGSALSGNVSWMAIGLA